MPGCGEQTALPHPKQLRLHQVEVVLELGNQVALPLNNPMPASLSPPIISIAFSFMKYFLVHGGFSTIDGNSANVVPLGLKIIVHVGAKSDHHHDVPMLNSRLTSFLSAYSFRS